MLGPVQGNVQHKPTENEYSKPDGNLIGHGGSEQKMPAQIT